jgi:hypothetical protein
MALVPEQKKGLVLLYNVNHAMMKMTFDEVGLGAAERLAGDPPSRSQLVALPRALKAAMPAMLLVPILQIADVVTTLRQLRRWRDDPAFRPSRGRLWGRYIVLPLIPNLLSALTLVPMVGNMRGFLRLFMPDFCWIAWVCGSFGLVWSFLRTALVLKTLRKPSPSPRMREIRIDGMAESFKEETLI